MLIFSLPDELPAPEVDYKNYDHDAVVAAEEEHKIQLKRWLLKNGYVSSLTGKILREPYADGYALYMVADSYFSWGLVHLPYGDGWHSPNVEFLPKAEVIKRVNRKPFSQLAS